MLEGIDVLVLHALPREAGGRSRDICPREPQVAQRQSLKEQWTRTVKLRGRAKAMTFYVFDPRHIEDILDRDLPALWREKDAQAVAEDRRRAAGKAALTHAAGKAAGAESVRKQAPGRLLTTGTTSRPGACFVSFEGYSAAGKLMSPIRREKHFSSLNRSERYGGIRVTVGCLQRPSKGKNSDPTSVVNAEGYAESDRGQKTSGAPKKCMQLA